MIFYAANFKYSFLFYKSFLHALEGSSSLLQKKLPAIKRRRRGGVPLVTITMPA